MSGQLQNADRSFFVVPDADSNIPQPPSFNTWLSTRMNYDPRLLEDTLNNGALAPVTLEQMDAEGKKRANARARRVVRLDTSYEDDRRVNNLISNDELEAHIRAVQEHISRLVEERKGMTRGDNEAQELLALGNFDRNLARMEHIRTVLAATWVRNTFMMLRTV